jgi:nucleotide-binding universal stress UspA family protein
VIAVFSNLVVALSGSEASIAAAKYSIILAKQFKSRLTAVYVIDTATIRQLAINRIFVPEESADYEKSLEDNGKRYLAYAKELAQSKGVPMDVDLRRGAVHTEIMACAEERKSDAILLGGWEIDRPCRDIFSLAHREIVFNASCSVVIVKEPLIDQMFRRSHAHRRHIPAPFQEGSPGRHSQGPRQGIRDPGPPGNDNRRRARAGREAHAL